jgi:parallel beta-helix repeat protein
MGTVTYINASGVEQIDNVPTSNPTAALNTLQNALNIAGARATDADPQTVTLSAGEFTIAASATGNGALEVPSNIILRGAGSTTIVKLAGSTNDDVTGVIRTKSGATQADGTPVTTRNVTIQDLVIDGNKSGQTSGEVDGFYCGPKPGTSSVDDTITLTNVTVQNCSRYGFNPHEQTTNLTFTNCHATLNKDGFTIDYSSDVTLTNCSATSNSRHGFNIVTSSHDVTLNNCTATGNGTGSSGGNGLTIQTGDNEARVWTQEINVWGGTYSNNTKAGILVTHASNVNIGRLGDAVTIEGNNEDGVRLQGVEDVYVNYNIIRSNGDTSTGSDAEIQIEGYLQDFDDGTGSAGSTAALNDLFIKSKNVNINHCTIGETGAHQAMYGILHNDIDAGQLHVGTNNTNNFASPNDIASYVYPPGQEPNPNDAPAYYFVITRGNDVISATAGTDVIAADSGNDIVSGMAGNDKLLGNDGNDSLNGGTGNDTLDGGFGVDGADYSGATSGVSVSLAITSAQAIGGGQGSDTLIGIENLVGSAYNDSLSGNNLANTLTGNAGSDTLDGAAGIDIAVIGLVDVAGGWYFVLSPTGASQVLPNGDTLINIEAIDVTLGSGNDAVTGGIGNDTLRGDGGADTLDGGAEEQTR